MTLMHDPCMGSWILHCLVLAGAHKRKEHVTSILHNSDHEVKSSASGCGVTQLDDYHIRLVCWLLPGTQQANGSWVPGLHSKRTVFCN